jgi:hypothetical protein
VASESLFSGLEVLDIAKGPVSMASVPSVEQLARSPRSARLGITTEVFYASTDFRSMKWPKIRHLAVV